MDSNGGQEGEAAGPAQAPPQQAAQGLATLFYILLYFVVVLFGFVRVCAWFCCGLVVGWFSLDCGRSPPMGFPPAEFVLDSSTIPVAAPRFWSWFARFSTCYLLPPCWDGFHLFGMGLFHNFCRGSTILFQISRFYSSWFCFKIPLFWSWIPWFWSWSPPTLFFVFFFPGQSPLAAHISSNKIDFALWCTRLITIVFTFNYLVPIFGWVWPLFEACYPRMLIHLTFLSQERNQHVLQSADGQCGNQCPQAAPAAAQGAVHKGVSSHALCRRQCPLPALLIQLYLLGTDDSWVSFSPRFKSGQSFISFSIF